MFYPHRALPILGIAASLALSGCAGMAQPVAPVPTTGAALQSRALSVPAMLREWSLKARPATGTPFMRPFAKPAGLLYVTFPGGPLVDVYSYPGYSIVGDLLNFSEPVTLCVDAAQNVYVPDFGAGRIKVYGRGAMQPKATLLDSHGSPIACAVNPKTGDLAVSNYQDEGSGPGNVIIYKGGKGTPKVYAMPSSRFNLFAAYDASGNLFVDGSEDGVLSELPAGKSAFSDLTLKLTLTAAGGLAWDGQYLVIADYAKNVLYRLKISGSVASKLGSTTLKSVKAVFQFFPAGQTAKHPQATMVFGADPYDSLFAEWSYPAGGVPNEQYFPDAEPSGIVLTK